MPKINFFFFKILTVVGMLIANFHECKCFPTNTQERSLADNYTALTEDVKWFFRGISKIAHTVEQMLPNVTMDLAKTRILSENTHITLLIGFRHFVVGVREISITFEKNFNTDHIKQLYQLKTVIQFINDVVNAIKIWFRQIRAIVVHLLFLYNRYFPELLLGKCFGNYLVITYPDLHFYEYPLILISEIYSTLVTNIKTESTDISTELPIINSDLNMEQNEISNSDSEDFKASYGTKSALRLAANSTKVSQSFERFFDFGTVLSSNKDEIIKTAANKQSWQICLKLYTAESISRSLKTYFLGL